jgi:hypothetical protein
MTAHKRHIVMKLSLMDKCSIKRNNLFDVTVEAIIDFMNDLMTAYFDFWITQAVT